MQKLPPQIQISREDEAGLLDIAIICLAIAALLAYANARFSN